VGAVVDKRVWSVGHKAIGRLLWAAMIAASTWLVPSSALALTGLAVSAAPAAVQISGTADVVSEVRAAIASGDLDRADTIFARRRDQHGARPDVVEALSWLGRGALAAGQLDRANRYAGDAQQLAIASLGKRSLTDEHLVTALGNAIEVQAQVSVQRGERSEAISFLQRELKTYKDTAIHKRIQKNINLLSLEGHPAPALDISEFIGPVSQGLNQLKGQVVVLFFWAHWCPDCKIEGPLLAKIFAKYRSQGLAVVAPTQRYGYGSEGVSLKPDDELRYIVRIRDTYYPFLADVPVPVSEANHKLYGVSSTPTLVIVDRQGIVRLYHPGRMTEDELEVQIRGLLGP
jgi:thiol-disulfide isomerase/thioredoxin